MVILITLGLSVGFGDASFARQINELEAIKLGEKACRTKWGAEVDQNAAFYAWRAERAGDHWEVWVCSSRDPSFCPLYFISLSKYGKPLSVCGRRID